MFRLPAYQDLSRQQDDVINLPTEGTHLIVGPPGTGKTVVALYRTKIFRNAGIPSTMVVFNNTLDQFLNLSTGKLEIDTNTSTFQKWFRKWYRDNFGRTPPYVSQYQFDWNQIYENIGSKGDSINKEEHIVLDEGQDFPRELYIALRLISKHITVFADENQRIRDQNSTIDEIRSALCLDEQYRLTKNYRNSRQIAEFCSQFYAGLQTGIPDLPDRQDRLPRLVLGKSYDDQIDVMTTYARNNPGKQIGVFVRDQKTQYGIYKQLEEKSCVPVQMYQSKNKNHKTVDFTKKGFYILCHASTKGLEFDCVFLPVLERARTDSNIDSQKMSMYVACSRARDDLFLITKLDETPWFMRHIPQNLFQRMNRT